MSGFFEKLFEERGSVDFGRKPENIIEGKNDLKGLLDKILRELKSFENQKNIDKIIGSGAAKELSDDIQIAKDILEKNALLDRTHSDGKEILRNIETSFTLFLRKAGEKGVERYADVIREKYEELKIFADLVIECEEFRKKEFDDASGYLTDEENKEKKADMRLNMHKYLRACKEKFEKKTD